MVLRADIDCGRCLKLGDHTMSSTERESVTGIWEWSPQRGQAPAPLKLKW